MVPVLAAVLVLAAPAAVDCPGAAEKPAPLRCYEAGDRAATVTAVRVELRRDDATADDRRFAAELGDVVLRELYTADNDPGHLCELEELLADYLATPGAVAAAKEHRERAVAERRKNHPGRRCAGETAASGTTTAPANSPSSAPPAPHLQVPPPATTRAPSGRAAPLRRKVPGMTIGGGALLVAAAGLGACVAGLAARRDDLTDRAQAVADEVLSGGGWTPALDHERERILEVDRRTYGATVGLAVSSGVFAALGVGLVVAGELGRARRQAEVAPYGDTQGAGLVLRRRF